MLARSILQVDGVWFGMNRGVWFLYGEVSGAPWSAWLGSGILQQARRSTGVFVAGGGFSSLFFLRGKHVWERCYVIFYPTSISVKETCTKNHGNTGGAVLILCFAPVRGFRRFVAFFFFVAGVDSMVGWGCVQP